MSDTTMTEEVKEETEKKVRKVRPTKAPMRGNSSKLHTKLFESSKFLQMKHGFYSDIFMRCTFWEEEYRVPTAGVNVGYRGFNFYYNPKFLSTLDQRKMNFVVIHEIYHLLHSHINRSKTSDHRLDNIIQDMIINTAIIELLGESPVDKAGAYLNKNNDPLLYRPFEGIWLVPVEYEGEHTFERLKEWVLDRLPPPPPLFGQGQGQGQSGEGQEKSDQSSQGSGQGQEQSEEKNKEGQGKSEDDTSEDMSKGQAVGDKRSRMGEGWEDAVQYARSLDEASKRGFDVHIDDDVPPELREEMINEAINACKARGLMSEEMEQLLQNLRRPKVNYLKIIKAHIGGMLGTMKHNTWQRFSRRATGEFLSRGYKKYRKALNVILDTSGSMSGEFERTLSYIFYNGIEVNLIQCDTQVHRVDKVTSKRQLQRLTIEGLGGTIIQPGIDHIVEDEALNKLPTILMTDGYTDTLDISGLQKQLLVLTTDVEVEIRGGHCKQVVIER